MLLGVVGLVYVAPLGRPGFLATQMGVLPLLRVLGRPLPPTTPVATDAAWVYGLARGLMRLGFSPGQALELLLVVAILLGGAGVAALAWQAWGWAPGVLAGALFFALPAHISARFIRGVPGEIWFWAVVVWAAWGASGLRRWQRLIGAMLAAFSLITWPTTTAVALPLLVLVGGGKRWSHVHRVQGVLGWIGAVLVLVILRWRSAVPASALFPFQLFSAAWPEPEAWVRGGSYQVGAVPLLGALVVLAQRWSADRLRERLSSVELGWAAALGLLAWAMVPWAPVTRAASAVGGHAFLVLLASVVLTLVVAHLPRLQPALAEWAWLSLLVALVAWSGYSLLTPPALPDVPLGAEMASFEVPDGGPALLLLGVEVEGQAVAGQVVRVKAYWQLLQPVSKDYTAFVHVVAPDGSLVAQGDRLLLAGERPTSGWGVGEVVVQSYEIALPAEAPPGPYTLRLGVYLAGTLERLPRTGGGDALEVPL